MAPTPTQNEIIVGSPHQREDHHDSDDDSDEDLQQTLFSKNKCFSCHCFPCFGSGGWERISPPRAVTSPEKDQRGKLWSRGRNAFMKLREWSELVAGPEWKTFIRRFSRKSTKQGKFQYDPMSYALNFEDVQGHNRHFDEDGDRLFRDFSSRYAAIPGSYVQRFTAAATGSAVPT